MIVVVQRQVGDSGSQQMRDYRLAAHCCYYIVPAFRDFPRQIMRALEQSRGFMGAETRVLVDSVVGFQALVDTGCISLLKVRLLRVNGIDLGSKCCGSPKVQKSMLSRRSLGLFEVEIFQVRIID